MKHARLLVAMILCFTLFSTTIFTSKHVVQAKPAASFELLGHSTELKNGDHVQLTIAVNNAERVYGYEVHLEYASEYLQFANISSPFSNMSYFQHDEEAPDRLKVFGTKTGNHPGENGEVDLVHVTFEAKAGFLEEKMVSVVKLVQAKLVSSKLETSTYSLDHAIEIVLLPAQEQGVVLTDIAGHWAEEVIQRALKLGFVQGFPDQTFRPDQPVSRAEFSVMLARALDFRMDAEPTSFNDQNLIPDWAEQAVAALTKEHIIQGYPDQTFRPAQPITRSELAVMMVRTLGLPIEQGAKTTFRDASEMMSWAEPAIAAAVNAGLLQGRGEHLFRPNAITTRAEAVKVMLNILDFITMGESVR